jgi:hypothetical protein
MKNRFITHPVLLALMVGIVTVGSFSEIQLRYGFKKDQTYKYWTQMKFYNEPAKQGVPSGGAPIADISVGFSLSVNKISSAGDIDCVFTADTLGIQMSDPSGANRTLTYEKLKGKSMRVLLDPMGVPKSIQPDDPSSLNQTRELGIEFFSRDLLNFTYMFVEYPAGSVEINRPWEYARTDTISRGTQQLIATRTTRCKLTGTATVGKRKCSQVAYTVVTRVRTLSVGANGGQGMTGETTATGVISLSVEGIPVKSEATIKASFTVGATETVQRRTLKTILD